MNYQLYSDVILLCNLPEGSCDATWKLFAIARNLNCHRNPVSEPRTLIRETGFGAIACTLGNRAFC
ncbi:MAG: hypothetical protein JGK12_30760 [Microcoleus sp. PH2017_01_SCD_O_A]|uniref:hypothetical protein n=1 Tax=Microcoleus sp. PH2017_01_SCD_O_A TaxID=2798812 RepID=UPI001DF33E95|nr:hypothetical protein [Microcoleus sp. PH2017_01_SCD_O_A]MCC3418889.1 hypothetical protein [Microcoleus sp. PH2017_07_MST_O_A]MCC3428183.1 hypothetical protein [Microcoleus sp. PH2017_01_SCD_O_A]MCC3512591.1 hypothetical protein [Microcoleus sp. PH2017_17_BER_D_A]